MEAANRCYEIEMTSNYLLAASPLPPPPPVCCRADDDDDEPLRAGFKLNLLFFPPC